MKRTTLLRILRFARPHMVYIVLSLVMAVGSVSMTLYAPVLIETIRMDAAQMLSKRRALSVKYGRA